MSLKKAIFRSSTALVVATGLVSPVAAQSLTDMPPERILEGAIDGTVDLGFDTAGLGRNELLATIPRMQMMCESGRADDAIDCARVAEIPQALTQRGASGGGEGQGNARRNAEAQDGTPAEKRPGAAANGNADARAGNGQAKADANAQAKAETGNNGQGQPKPEATDKPVETAQAQSAEEARKKRPDPAAEAAQAGREPGQPVRQGDDARPNAPEQQAATPEPAPNAAPEAAEAPERPERPERQDAEMKRPRENPAREQGQAAETGGEALPDDTARALEQAQQGEPLRTTETPQAGQQPQADATPETSQAAETARGDERQRAEEARQAAREQRSVEEPAQVSDQEQADAVAERARRMGSAAAAGGDTAEAEVVEEDNLTQEDVRSSQEDFRTRIGEAAPAQERPRASNDDDDDDNDGIGAFGKAAIAGLGALALNQILSDDARVVENTGDRLVVEENGQYRVLRNDDALLRQPGSDVTTYRYDDGSTRTVVVYEDGNEVQTIKAADGRVLRRTRTLPDGETIVLFDNTQAEEEVAVSELPQTNERPRRMNIQEVDENELAAALAAESAEGIDRRFSLNQIRNINAVRHLVPEISVDTINFETGSAAIRPEEAQALAALGNAMKQVIADRPGEVFLIEGHTDAIGGWSYNLALSDRRAESVALALTEYFDVPPENMVLQGYGEGDLAVETQQATRENRRAAVRRITPLLQGG